MKITIIKLTLALLTAMISSTAIAYEDEPDKPECKKPKFHDFSLPLYKEPDKTEVPPESEFEFKVSAWSDPETIRLTAKKEKIAFTVESNSSFHRVKAKLPASLTGKFARIDAYVKAVLGCHQQEGWLIKIADNQAAVSTPVKAESKASEQQPASSESDKAPATEKDAVNEKAESPVTEDSASEVQAKPIEGQ